MGTFTSNGRHTRKSKHFEWSKILTGWVMLVNSYVVYHGINLCYVMIESGSAAYSFGWLAALITAVAGLGNIVIVAYMNKSGKEGVEKIKTNSMNENYP